MTLERLQNLNLLRRIGFSILFIIIAFIIFIGIIDRSILHLSYFAETTQFSTLNKSVFFLVMSSALVTQSIFFYKIYVDTSILRKTKLKNLYLIPLMCHFINLSLIAILLTQISYESGYSKFLILFTIWINTGIGISVLVVLAYRFILWLKESSKKSFVVITYVTSIILFVVLNGAILLYFTLGYRVGLAYITSRTEPSNIFSSPHIELSLLISVLGITSFFLLWVSSILLLIYHREKIKKKYFLVIGASLVVFLSHYFFLWGFGSMRLTNFIIFHDIYAITSVISLPLGGIFFGFTFWILARNINVAGDGNLRHKEEYAKVKQYMYLTAIGIILLVLSASPLDITRLPYPPFGMVSFTFMNVGALSFFLGIYKLATAIGASSSFRQGLMKSDFLSSIGSSQERLSRRSNLVQILKHFKSHLLDTEIVQEEIDKEYIKDVVTERRRRFDVPDQVIFTRDQSPLGRPWEAWTVLWCRWYYRDRLTDQKYEKWSQDNNDREVWFLCKTLIDPSKQNIHCETTVTKGRLLFFPLVNNLISFYEYPNLKSENDLKMFSKSDADKKRIVFLSINGHEVKNIEQYRIQSHLFDLVSLKDNAHESQKIKTQAIADGYWLFLHLLKSGRNKIYFTLEVSLSEDILEDPIQASQKDKLQIEVNYDVNIIEN